MQLCESPRISKNFKKFCNTNVPNDKEYVEPHNCRCQHSSNACTPNHPTDEKGNPTNHKTPQDRPKLATISQRIRDNGLELQTVNSQKTRTPPHISNTRKTCVRVLATLVTSVVLSVGFGHSLGATADGGASQTPAKTVDEPTDVLPEPLRNLDASVLELLQTAPLPQKQSDGSHVATISTGGDGTGEWNVSAPSDGSGKISVMIDDNKSILIEIAQADTREAVAELGDWGLCYDGHVPQVVTFPQDAVLETFSLLTSSKSPSLLSTEIGLPDGFELKSVNDDLAVIIGQDHVPVLFIEAPWALDATGRSVPVSIEVNGDRLVLNVNHIDHDYTYPIVVDPSYSGYNPFNSAAERYCAWPSRWSICRTARNTAGTASASAANLFPQNTLHNGYGDAYRHCYWSALMTIRMGGSTAQTFGDLHEEGSTEGLEVSMDQRNNRIGRAVGGDASRIHANDSRSIRDSYAREECESKARNGRVWIIGFDGKGDEVLIYGLPMG